MANGAENQRESTEMPESFGYSHFLFHLEMTFKSSQRVIKHIHDPTRGQLIDPESQGAVGIGAWEEVVQCVLQSIHRQVGRAW